MSRYNFCDILCPIKLEDKMIKLSKSSQTGRSMIEAIGYISVMIMISVSVAAAVNRGYYKYRVSRINQELSDLKGYQSTLCRG